MARSGAATRREQQRMSAREGMNRHKSLHANAALKLPSGVKLWKVEDDKLKKIRIVPYEAGKGNPCADEGEQHMQRTYWVHRIGPNFTMCVCLSRTFKKPCYACEKRAEMARDPRFSKDDLKAFNSSERELWNVIDVDNEKEGVQVFDYSSFLFGDALRDKIEKDISRGSQAKGYEFYADAKEGFILEIEPREKKQGGYTFYDLSDIGFIADKDGLDDKVLKEAVCLDDCIQEMSYEEMKSIIEGGGEEEEKAERNGERETRGRGRKEEEDEPRGRGGRSSRDEESAPFAEGDLVSFEYKGRTLEGKVVSVNERREIAEVDTGERKPSAVDFKDLTKVDEKPKRGRGKEEDESRGRSRDAEDEPRGRGRRDEEEPSRGRGKEPDSEFKVSDWIDHKRYGRCEVVRIQENGDLTVEEEKSGDLHKDVDPKDCTLEKVGKKDDKGEPASRGRDREEEESPRRSRDEDESRGRGREEDEPRVRGRSSRDEDEPRGRSRGEDEDRPRGRR